MTRPLPGLALLTGLLLLPACAAVRQRAEARRTWSDLVLDDPLEPERLLAFLATYDPGPAAGRPACVRDALTALDTWRRESRHWIAEVVAANARFAPPDLEPATLQELADQLTALVLLLGPPAEGTSGWPATANPYPWRADDGEQRAVVFDLYVEAGRFCPAAPTVPAGCLIDRGGAVVPLPWALAGVLVARDARLLERVRDPAAREAIAALGG